MRKIRKAVIPAAGLGTRFLPATKAQPKEMLPIVDKPTIQYIVEEAIRSGIEDIIIVTGRNKRAIEDHFDRSMELEAFLEKNAKDELLDLVQDVDVSGGAVTSGQPMCAGVDFAFHFRTGQGKSLLVFCLLCPYQGFIIRSRYFFACVFPATWQSG